MRGKDDRPCAYDHTDRITPAYAGKSGWFQRRLQHGGGSPPRMRGKDLVKFCLCPRFGITPAYAGKSPRTPLAASHARDHPRVCGEKPVDMHTRITSAGSPPRMRGKVYMRCCACRQPRITPAYAGKRVDLANTGKCPRDHPRVCGEKFRGARFRDRRMGSPPRMRGKATSSCFWQLLRGDHPRVCGEKQAAHNT